MGRNKILNKYFKNLQIKRKISFYGNNPLKKYKMAVIIPVYGEYDYIGKTLYSLSVNNCNYLEKTLIIVVINNPVTGANNNYVKENQRLLKKLEKGVFQRNYVLDNINLCWIDASSTGLELPGRGGVGMARKLGMDSMLEYIDWANKSLIISLDADTIVENNYLQSIENFFKNNKNIKINTFS